MNDNLEPSERANLYLQWQNARRERRVRGARDSFLTFCSDPELFDDQTPARHHKLLCATLEAAFRGEITRLMVILPPGYAKALELGTPIPTPSGWKAIVELEVGDEVFDERGYPCRVIRKSPIWYGRPVYEVTTDCGDKIIADAAHEWVVRLDRKRPVFKTYETQKLAARKSPRRPLVARAEDLYLPTAKLLVDPYVLGAWLGDGTSADASITCGPEDEAQIRRLLENAGQPTKTRGTPGRIGLPGLRAGLAKLKLLNNKHIPKQYLWASSGQRIDLLQGLIDTDGHVNPIGQVQFTSTNQLLAQGVQHLVRSLGAKASIYETRAMLRGKDCGPVWRVTFFLNCAARLPRKRARCRNAQRTKDTYLSFKTAGRADTVCIEVDSPSHLFLCGRSMTPTHNSTYSTKRFPSWWIGCRPKDLGLILTNSDELSQEFGRSIKNIVASYGYQSTFPAMQLAEDSKAKHRWHTTQGGGLFAAGITSTFIGRRANFAILDDLISGWEEADSVKILKTRWETYRSDVRSRLLPGAPIIMVGTRWTAADIMGRILPEDWKGGTGWVEGRDGESWYVLHLAAKAIPGIEDPLGRKPGEPLWPEFYTKSIVDAEEYAQGVYNWGSLYQGVPTTDAGSIIKASWWRQWPINEPPVCDLVFDSYDTAFSEEEVQDEHSYSARTTWGLFDIFEQDNAAILKKILDEDKQKERELQRMHLCLLGGWREKVGFPELREQMISAQKASGTDLIIIERKASGPSLIQEAKRMRLPVKVVPPKGEQEMSKTRRAMIASILWQHGCVWYMNTPACVKIKGDVSKFPRGESSDWTDTATQIALYCRRKYHLRLHDEEIEDDDMEPGSRHPSESDD